jgi:hypothetical protein
MSEQELAFGFQDVLISGPLWFSAKTNIMAHVLHCNYHNLFSLASQIVLDFFSLSISHPTHYVNRVVRSTYSGYFLL